MEPLGVATDLFDPSTSKMAAGRPGGEVHPELIGILRDMPDMPDSHAPAPLAQSEEGGQQKRPKLKKGRTARALAARLGPKAHDSAYLRQEAGQGSSPTTSHVGCAAFFRAFFAQACELHPVFQIFNSKDLWIPRIHLAITLFHDTACAMAISTSHGGMLVPSSSWELRRNKKKQDNFLLCVDHTVIEKNVLYALVLLLLLLLCCVLVKARRRLVEPGGAWRRSMVRWCYVLTENPHFYRFRPAALRLITSTTVCPLSTLLSPSHVRMHACHHGLPLRSLTFSQMQSSYNIRTSISRLLSKTNLASWTTISSAR